MRTLFIAIMSTALLLSGSKKEEKSFETITQTFKYGDRHYRISFKLYNDDKMEEIPGADNEAFRTLIKSYPE
jgi:hypothetical protein